MLRLEPGLEDLETLPERKVKTSGCHVFISKTMPITAWKRPTLEDLDPDDTDADPTYQPPQETREKEPVRKNGTSG